MWALKLFFMLNVIAYTNVSYAQSILHGKVVRILDGDTYEILINGNTTYKIRMTDIDAPEKSQDFGQRSKQTLSALIFGKDVKVIYDKLDRNKRILGHTYQNGLYINLIMVQKGMAWHFKKYSSDHTFAQAEEFARKQKIGIWSKSNAIAPWDYRSSRRKH
jgi:micrococcal nuclease